MEKYKYLIVGGGVAGVTAAETIRGQDQTGTIAVVSDETEPLYSRVMLSKPNFFLGKIPFDQVWLKGREWYLKNQVTFLGGKTAVALDAAKKVLTLADGENLEYEKLLIATGVQARRSTVPGSDKKGVHYLRTLEDGKSIMEHLKTAHTAVTVGGGFISFEMADLLELAGLDTTLLLRESYFWEPVLDEASGLMIERAINASGVKILKQTEIAGIKGSDKVESLALKNGTNLPCDLLVCGIGVTNPIAWAQASGAAVNRGILANEYLETNLPDVWTAGDIAEYQDLLLEENVQMGNWVNAHEQGKVAGLNMLGQHQQFKFVSFYTTQGFGISIAFVGDVSPGPDRIIIPRGSPEINSYARLIVVGKELVGATLINRTGEMTTISKLIEKNVDVSQKQAELSDPNFDLKSLLG